MQFQTRNNQIPVVPKSSDMESLNGLRSFAETGDNKALARFIQKHQKEVFGFCYRWLRSAADAEDAAQAVFMDVMRRPQDYKKIQSVKGWLYGLARKACHHKVRSETRRSRRERISHESKENISWCSPEQSAELSDTQTAILQILRTLPEKYQTPFLMRYFEGLTDREISTALKINESTLRCRLMRGLQMMRANLKKHGTEVSAAVLVQEALNCPAPQPTASCLEMLENLPNQTPLDSLASSLPADSSSWSSISWIVAVAGITLAGTLYWEQSTNTTQPPSAAKATEMEAPPVVLIEENQAEEFNHTWSFEEGFQKSFTCIEGEYAWIPKIDFKPAGTAFSVDQITYIKFPQKLSNIPTKVVVHFYPLNTGDLVPWIEFFLANKNSLLPKKIYASSPKGQKELPLGPPSTLTVYFWKNKIGTLLNQQPFSLQEYETDYPAETLVLGNRKIVINNIAMKTINESELPDLTTNEWGEENLKSRSFKSFPAKTLLGTANPKKLHSAKKNYFKEHKLAAIPGNSITSKGLIISTARSGVAGVGLMEDVGIHPLEIKIKANILDPKGKNMMHALWRNPDGSVPQREEWIADITVSEINEITFYMIGNSIVGLINNQVFRFDKYQNPIPGTVAFLRYTNLALVESNVRELKQNEIPDFLRDPQKFLNDNKSKWNYSGQFIFEGGEDYFKKPPDLSR